MRVSARASAATDAASGSADAASAVATGGASDGALAVPTVSSTRCTVWLSLCHNASSRSP